MSDPSLLLALSAVIFLVAALYSSVGHGGASGYLAVMSFLVLSPQDMSTTALILNLAVAGIAFYNYMRAGYFCWALTWPFMAASIPAAFLGGMMTVADQAYFLLLALVLLYSAFRMLRGGARDVTEECGLPRFGTALSAGAGIGLLSGIVGVGGGIFLSPLIMMMRWGTAKQTAATSAVFILVNSAAGLAGRFTQDHMGSMQLWPLLLAGILGALAGSHYGAHRASSRGIRRLLALVLVVAAVKMLLKYF